MLTKKFLENLLLNSGVDIEKEDIKHDASFSSLGLDSLDMFNFFTEIDSELNIEIPDEEFEKLDTINKVYEYLKLHLN